MKIQFFKYQGTGNDFVMLDNRNSLYQNLNTAQIQLLCDRHFGIGADGLILLENHSTYDFEMIYYNSDGNKSSMCGNGGRCAVRFAADQNSIKNLCTFLAIDGSHDAQLLPDNKVSLKMKNVSQIIASNEALLLNTGSPHYVCFIKDKMPSDFVKQAEAIRNQPAFKKEGINVNFVIAFNQKLQIRTYERGVENETLSCGTGVTAAALASSYAYPDGAYNLDVETQGGVLQVSFMKCNESYENIWLTGEAKCVFSGEIII